MEPFGGIMEHWPMVAWVASMVAIIAQNQANSKAMRERQDETNEHLSHLNNKTFTIHGRVESLRGAVQNLPCRNGKKLSHNNNNNDC